MIRREIKLTWHTCNLFFGFQGIIEYTESICNFTTWQKMYWKLSLNLHSRSGSLPVRYCTTACSWLSLRWAGSMSVSQYVLSAQTHIRRLPKTLKSNLMNYKRYYYKGTANTTASILTTRWRWSDLEPVSHEDLEKNRKNTLVMKIKTGRHIWTATEVKDLPSSTETFPMKIYCPYPLVNTIPRLSTQKRNHYFTFCYNSCICLLNCNWQHDTWY